MTPTIEQIAKQSAALRLRQAGNLLAAAGATQAYSDTLLQILLLADRLEAEANPIAVMTRAMEEDAEEPMPDLNHLPACVAASLQEWYSH